MLPVIPPITGGLHCGHLLVSVVVRAARVIPPITGGLHCGGRDREGYDRDGWRHPAHYGRAPLRLRRGRTAETARHESSRPLRAGSIAAVMRLPGHPGTAHGHPAHYGRAPLRHLDLRRRVDDPRGHPAHYGRAPLRPAGYHDTVARDAAVIPPITGGLHCGAVAAMRRVSGHGHPAHYGRAPLRPHLRPLPVGGLPGHPAHYGRAPLRHPDLRAAGEPVPRHPAHYVRAPLRQDRGRRTSRDHQPSSRPLRAGSIAATWRTGSRCRTGAVIPPITGGLHCGSISGTMFVHRLARHPAHYGRAPLRQTGAGTSPPGSQVVIPPITGGLHCGPVSTSRQSPPCAVIPPITGGLHCGVTGDASSSATSSVIPPITGGLHCGSGSAATSQHGYPVIPPITGGLHCGGA